MPKTVTLSDDELVALQAMRQVVADVQHPARPAAIAALDRINAAVDEPRWPVHGYSDQQPLDLSQPDGHRCSTISWDNTLGWSMGDIAIPAGGHLRLELKRPGSDTALLCWPLDVGAEHRRTLYKLCCSVFTRPTPQQTLIVAASSDESQDDDIDMRESAFADQARAECR
jgi:hypothetical protein